jgi:hypothetical protein
MRRLTIATLAGAVGVLLAIPAGAQQQANPIEVIADAFQTTEGQAFVSQFLKLPVPGTSTVSDPVGDYEHSTGQPPGYTPMHIDIVDTWSTEFDPGPLAFFGPTDANTFWSPTGIYEVTPPNFESFHTFTGDEIHDGSQYDGGAILFGFTLADTPPVEVTGRCEYVVWVNDLSRGPTFINHPTFPGDPAGGTNVAFGLGINPEGQGLPSTFAIELQQKNGGFVPNFETDIRSFITPNFVGLTVPKSQIGELGAVNFYSFCVESGFSFAPVDSGADQTGLITVGFDDLGLLVVEEVPVAAETTTTITTIEETTTTSAVSAPTTTVAVDSGPGEQGDFPWWLVLLGGLGLAALGWWLFAKTEGDPCKELYDGWMAAQKRCDEAQREADEAIDECWETEAELEDLEQERKDVCKAWPPACWDSEEGGWVQDDQGNRITSRDLHMRRLALGEVWDDHKAGKLTAQEVEAKWREMDTPEFREDMRMLDEEFKDHLEEIEADLAEARRTADETCDRASRAQATADEACAAADAARKAYEECIAAAVAEAGAGPAPGGPETPPTGPTGPGVAPGTGATTTTDPCEGVDPRRKYVPAGSAARIRVNVDFSIIIGRQSGSERNTEAGEQLVVNLGDLARDLDFAGDMLNARSAGLHAGGAATGYAQGKYVATAAGVVKGGIDATMATTDLIPDVPTTPLQAGTEFLEKTAQLGGLVAGKVTEWMANYQIITVRRSFFYQFITATPYTIWECRESQGWVCVEQVWEYEVSKLMVLKGQDRWYTVNSDVRRREFDRAVSGLANAAGSTIRNDAQRLVEFRSRHEPGPCED